MMSNSRYQATDHYIVIDGLNLHYLDWGNHHLRPMILLHGFTGHAHVWDEFSRAMRYYFHVIALDQRGHGKSQWSKNSSYSIDNHFKDLRLFIKKMGMNKPILIGHSMGGRNALFYSVCRPETVDKLILVDARPGNSQESSMALKQHINNIPIQVESLDQVTETLIRLYRYLPEKTCRHMVKHGFIQNKDGTYKPRCDTIMGEESERSGCVIDDLWPFLENVTCPVLIIRGKESAFISKREGLQMCQSLPRAEFKEITNSTHMPAQENPALFLQAVLEFLEIKPGLCCSP